MNEILEKLFENTLDNLKTGNSNLTEEQAIQLIDMISDMSNKTKRISKYKACSMLGVSSTTFNTYISTGKLPKGIKEPGFKELSWNIKDIETFIKKYKTPKKEKYKFKIF